MNALAIAPQQESKDIKLSSKKVADSTEEEGKDFFGNLISGLISEESEDSKGENSDFLLSKLLNVSTEVEKKEDIVSDFSQGTLVLDNPTADVTIQDLLKISLSLKNGDDVAEFPTESQSLKLALLKPDVKEQFKDAKNIKDLLDVAKKNNIEVKNFQFFKEEAALTPQDKKMVQKINSEDIFKLVEKQFDTKTKPTTSTLDTLNTSKDSNTKATDTKTTILQSVLASTDSSRPKQERTEKIKTVTNENKIKTINSDKTVVKDVEIAQSNRKDQPSVEQIKTANKEVSLTEPIKEQNQQLKEILQQTTKTQQNNKEMTLVQKSESLSEKVETTETVETSEPTEKTSLTNESKTTQIEKSKESVDVKKTFSTFAQEFKEKVESYKPPLMKIKMELKPEGLGNVDVTLLNRGNNLQVNINSNSNTIAMFMQNQTEFKNSLVNMGFSDLQMNFGDNQQKGQEEQNQKNNKNVFDLDDIEEEQDGFEMIIPQYV